MTSTIQNGEGVEPFMPVAKLTDDMLIDTGNEVVTWGELLRRQSLAREPATADVERVAREIAIKHALPGVYDGISTHATRRGDADGRPYLVAIREALSRNELGKSFECAAARQGTAGGHDPVSCDYPECGCDDAAPTSEPAIAEGERVIADGVYAGLRFLDGQLSRSEITAVQHKTQVTAILAALAQSSTPPASKGVEEDDIVERSVRVACEAYAAIRPTGSKLWNDLDDMTKTLAICAARNAFLAVSTNSNDTLQQRGSVERVVEVLERSFSGAVIIDNFRENGHAQTEEHDACEDLPSVARDILAALHPTPSNDTLQGRGEWHEVEQPANRTSLKGLRRSPKYYPAIGEICRMSGPHCDDADGYTWADVEVLWRDDLFIVTRTKNCWPTVTKLELALFEPTALQKDTRHDG